MDQARVIENLLAQVDGLKAQLASSTGQEAPPSQEQGGAKDGEVLSGLDFKAGERNFTSSSTTSVQIMADFTSKERTYTNGIVAKNEWRQQEGALTKETINIPDVVSSPLYEVNSPHHLHFCDLQELGLSQSCESSELGRHLPFKNRAVESCRWQARRKFSQDEVWGRDPIDQHNRRVGLLANDYGEQNRRNRSVLVPCF
jgi:hypothetical protein